MINKELRLRILEIGKIKKMGHYGSSMSCLDTIKYLYDEVLTDDDVFILSKGHGAPALHAVLETKGFTPPWTIHNEYDEANGIKATTGSLGLGLPTAIGRALAKKLKGEKGQVYCMVGDGEMQEGVIWESLNIAKRFHLDNFILLIDYNKYQAISSVEEIMWENDESLRNKVEAFGFEVYDIYDGHNTISLSTISSIMRLFSIEDKTIYRYPKCFLIHTIKGYGIPLIERNSNFHVIYQHEHEEDFEEARRNLQ
jgi:transketolase